jgi:hypothetical protein
MGFAIAPSLLFNYSTDVPICQAFFCRFSKLFLLGVGVGVIDYSFIIAQGFQKINW